MRYRLHKLGTPRVLWMDGVDPLLELRFAKATQVNGHFYTFYFHKIGLGYSVFMSANLEPFCLLAYLSRNDLLGSVNVLCLLCRQQFALKYNSCHTIGSILIKLDRNVHEVTQYRNSCIKFDQAKHSRQRFLLNEVRKTFKPVIRI